MIQAHHWKITKQTIKIIFAFDNEIWNLQWWRWCFDLFCTSISIEFLSEWNKRLYLVFIEFISIKFSLTNAEKKRRSLSESNSEIYLIQRETKKIDSSTYKINSGTFWTLNRFAVLTPRTSLSILATFTRLRKRAPTPSHTAVNRWQSMQLRV